ncbi:MAG: M18 family aminopeptidase [Clostridiaceae bacterium]
MTSKELAQDLIEFLHKGASAYQAVDVMVEELEAAGYREIKSEEPWTLAQGDKVYYIKNGSSIIAVDLGEGTYQNGFRLIGSHSDSPSFRIKPNSEMRSEGFVKLNTEVYGGPILNTWFDRPLSVAGRVALKSEDIMKPILKNINIQRPILYIPNPAIHMNRDVNKGVELNKQTQVLPIIALEETPGEDKIFLNLVAAELDVLADDILDFELYLYETAKGQIIGLNDEFISSKRMDNLAMAHASMRALTQTKGKGIRVAAVFDNEEVGSKTKQGAGSPMLANLLERIVFALGGSRADFLEALEKSFLISADLAHAVHPNFQEFADPTNKPRINQGPVIKIAANQSYTSDAQSTAVFKGICEKAEIPCQVFVNRSDKAGGSTIGPISSSMLPIRSVDIGTPILAMHSIRELGGVEDHYFVYQAFKVFYSI